MNSQPINFHCNKTSIQYESKTLKPPRSVAIIISKFRIHKYYPSDVISRHSLQKIGRLVSLQEWNINVIFRVSLICNEQKTVRVMEEVIIFVVAILSSLCPARGLMCITQRITVVYTGANRLVCLHRCGIRVCFDADLPHNQHELNDCMDVLCSCKAQHWMCQNKDHHILSISFKWAVTELRVVGTYIYSV